MLLWCFSGCFASLANGLGLYDGLSEALSLTLIWGVPYLIGRLYFGDADGLRAFAVAIVVGGLAYVIPCLLEMRLSPFIRRMVYGISNWHGTRYGGWRPDVFFATGLELGMWMSAASLAAWWLWRCGALKNLGQFRFGPVLLPALMVTTILCRSTGALSLQLMGMAVLWLSTRFKTRLFLAVLLLAGPLYVAARVTNLWSGQQAVDVAINLVGPERAQSLEYRFMCENLLVVKALQQPIFGWGGFGRSAVYFDANKPWRKNVPTDGAWIICLGSKGFVGLTLFYVAMVLPAARFVWRVPARMWLDPWLAAGSLAAVLLGLYIVDCLMNFFPNIIYVTAAGGLMGLDPRQLGARMASQGLATAAGASKVALADGNHRLGRTLKCEGRFSEAEAVWGHAVELLGTLIVADPGNLDLRRRWCDCANDLAWLTLHYPGSVHGDSSSAVALACEAVEMCPDCATYWNTLGVAYFRAGDATSAVTTLEHAKAVGGGSAFDDVFLAMSHARLGDREQAERRLAEAISGMERDDRGHPELGRFCHEARSVLAESFGKLPCSGGSSRVEGEPALGTVGRPQAPAQAADAGDSGH